MNATASVNATSPPLSLDAPPVQLLLFFALCLLLTLALIVVLFGGVTRRSFAYMCCAYAGLWCYNRCCACSKRHPQRVTEKATELRIILEQIDDNE